MRRRRRSCYCLWGHATVDDVADVADAVATIYKTRFALGVCLCFCCARVVVAAAAFANHKLRISVIA